MLVFRGQEKLTPERHVEFSRHFGGLYHHVIGASVRVSRGKRDAVLSCLCVSVCLSRWPRQFSARWKGVHLTAIVYPLPSHHALAGEFRLPGHEEIVVVSNELAEDGKTPRGLNGIDEGASKNGRRHFWHR